MIEFLLVGIPVLFALLAIAQVSIGMFTYNTLASGVDVGTRYASIHSSTVGTVAQQIVNNSPGLNPAKLALTFSGTTGGTSTTAGTLSTVATCTASACLASATAFPAGNAFYDTLTVSGIYPFATPFAMFWPTVGPMKLAGTVNLGATTTQLVQ
jgi:Flp pilus assembly protein TadG